MAYLSMGEAHRRITDYLNRFSDADALNIFKEFRNWDTAWALPALYVIAYDIRVLAERLHLCRGVIRSIETANI
ncbi:hypothetical protein DVH24_042742 [Malus domestica]|uniref:Uncharacterized protein n=1 Tax=Malus domestica TaxID=3750 RepID=A0A498I1V3_MALDO|nr:hypothetical protein DVH24_042742 [Malus domestica]